MQQAYHSSDIYRILEDEIINLHIVPGQTLSENDLCARFGVSRTPIRAVLQRLAENGLVCITPHKSTTVTLLDYDIINQIIYQRVAVECMVVRDFMRLCTPMQIEKIRYLIRRSRALLQEEFESRDFYLLDSELHALWFSETRKEYLWDCIQRAQSNYSRFRMLDIVATNHYGQIVEEHEELLDILQTKAEDAIEPFMVRHLYGGVTRLGEHIYTDLKGYFLQK